ncbi:hypothetical protein BH11MYX4_BH11MYX4_60700 [soil metagenome]
MRLSFFASSLFLAASACTIRTGDDDTSRYETRDLAPSFVATSDGNKVTVVAQLYAHGGGLHGLALGDGDQLQVTLDGAPVPLAKDGDAYQGRVAQPVQPAHGLLQFLFLRTKRQDSLTASTVFLHDPFTVESSPSSWSAGGELAVRTSGIKATEVDGELEGSCVADEHAAPKVLIGSKGDVVVDASRVHLVEAPDCEVSVSLRLTKQGAVDPTLGVPTAIEGGGGVRAVQERRFSVHVSP